MNIPESTLEIAGVILSILGSIALFLFGMKTMSEALQKLGGEFIRKSLSSLASSKTKGFFSGLFITGTIQSSTALTIMLVSLINAGFFSLNQSVSIMIGANVGTTLTAWLIALLGFNNHLEVILLPIMAATLPFIFRKNKKYRNVAELITGFILIFTGFYFLRESVPSVTNGSGAALSFYNLTSTYSINLAFAISGLILSFLIRSSSAASALTIVMCFNGWMHFEHAAAMIIGENIGTSFTAIIAAKGAINPARRLALSHLLFNLTGAIIFFTFFTYLVDLTSDLTKFFTGNLPGSQNIGTPVGLAIFHSSFNLMGAFIVIVLYRQFIKLLQLILPVKQNEEKKSGLKYIDTGYLAMTEMTLMQVHDEIVNYGQHILEMFTLIPEYLSEKDEVKFNKLQKKILKFEEKADYQEIVISNFLTRISADGLTIATSRKVSSMLKIIDDIESIGDQCMQLEKTIRLKNQAKAWLNPEMREQIVKMFNLVKEALNNMNTNLSKEYTPGILVRASELEIKINDARDTFLQVNKKNIDEGQYSYQNGTYFSDIANHCEKIGDHIINVNQAIASNVKSSN